MTAKVADKHSTEATISNSLKELKCITMINSFPGYQYVQFGDDGQPHNMYRGEDVGFGGYVYAEPGMYGRTVCFDVSGMHPASIRAMNCFGEYTKNFGDLVDARLAIKHKDFETAKTMGKREI